MVVAEFHDRASLTGAVRDLLGHGVPADSIHVYVGLPDGQRRRVPVAEGSGALRGALLGAAAGAGVGAALVALTVAGVFGEPTVGLFDMRGIVGAARTILLTAASAVPLGALLGMGRWRSTGAISDRELGEGKAEVVVTSEELEPRAREILERAGTVRSSGR
jgi:hypothetical protein